MNWSRHMILLTISAALLVVVAVTGAWAVESGFGTRADAGSLPLVALGSATTAPGSSSAPNMTGAAGARLVVSQSLRMSSGPIKSSASGAGDTMMTSPPTAGSHGTPGTTMPTGAGHGDMSSGTTMGTQSTTGTTAHTGSGGMMGTTPTTSAQSSMPMTTATSPPNTTRTTTSPSVTPTTTHMDGTTAGGGTGGSMGGTTGASGMGGMTTP